MPNPRLPHNRQTNSARFRDLFIRSAIFLDVSSNAKVHVGATPAILLERFAGREDWQQGGIAVHGTVLCGLHGTAILFRTTVLVSATRNGDRHLNPSVPLAKPIRHGLREALNRFGETFPAFERGENLRDLPLGELEQRMPVAFAQSGRCLLPLRRNFARLAQELLDTPGSDMEVLRDPFRPAWASGHRNLPPRLRPAPPGFSQVRNEFPQLPETLNAAIHQIRVGQSPREIVGGQQVLAPQVRCAFLG